VSTKVDAYRAARDPVEPAAGRLLQRVSGNQAVAGQRPALPPALRHVTPPATIDCWWMHHR
jgi:hypothetical protein